MREFSSFPRLYFRSKSESIAELKGLDRKLVGLLCCATVQDSTPLATCRTSWWTFPIAVNNAAVS